VAPVSCDLAILGFDANNPLLLATFWSNTLGWPISDPLAEEIEVVPHDGTPFTLMFARVPEPKTSKNPIHLDLVAESVEHQQEIVDALLVLGAQHVDIGQRDVPHVVLGDPEGNEFCIVLRGEFLADTGYLGAIVFEPAHPATGYFWSEAIGWPVVFDEDGDVAIRATDGQGPFITFGPPGIAKHAKNRLHFDLTPRASTQAAEVNRLIALGARHIDIGQGDASWVVMADPDGNEFCVLRSR
jgi:hypothetical protein